MLAAVEVAGVSIRFRRSIKLFPGVRLHIGKSGVGISVGPRGLHVGRRANGTCYLSAGIPGTGVYATQEARRA